MKKMKFVWGLILITSFASCKKDKNKEEEVEPSILSTNIAIDIPESISHDNGTHKSAGIGEVNPIKLIERGFVNIQRSGQLSGDEVYENLRYYIRIGEGSAEIVEAIITAINQYDINKAMELDYVSNDDGRTKHLSVVENANFDNKNWEYKMTISDNGNKAMQVFWNNTSVDGITILSPYYIDMTNTDISYINTLYRIDYTEEDVNYDATMNVSIAGLPVVATDTMALKSLRMFAGKKGDIIDVYGNSEHPNIILVDPTYTGGRNYAFVARGHDVSNIGLAKVALPPSSVLTNTSILNDYSIETVLTQEINAIGITDPTIISAFLANTVAPGYFDPTGFISAGTAPTSPTGFSSSFNDISSLKPFVPNDVKNLVITFQD